MISDLFCCNTTKLVIVEGTNEDDSYSHSLLTKKLRNFAPIETILHTLVKRILLVKYWYTMTVAEYTALWGRIELRISRNWMRIFANEATNKADNFSIRYLVEEFEWVYCFLQKLNCRDHASARPVG